MTTPTTQREADERAKFDAYCDDAIDGSDTIDRDWLFNFCTRWQARAATDQPSAGLTDERIDQIARDHSLDGSMLNKPRHAYWRMFAHAIEREVRASLTTTAPQAEIPAEPVANRFPYLGLGLVAPQAVSQQAAKNSVFPGMVPHKEKMVRVPYSEHYSNKNHSAEFKCPVCGNKQRRNLNFLGAKVLFCDGAKITIEAKQ